MSPALIALVFVALFCGGLTWLVSHKSSRAALWLGALSLLMLALGGYIFSPILFSTNSSLLGSIANPENATPQNLVSFRPHEAPSDGYVTADQCAECHKSNFDSWHNSYHRTMTQLATPDAVMGKFEGQTVKLEGVEYRLSRKGDAFWADITMPGPMRPDGSQGEGAVNSIPLVMTTGSHHMQVYWFPSGSSRILGQLPIVYLKQRDRWVPRNSCFLEPPKPSSAEMGRWNNTCSQCHTTHPKQRNLDSSTWDTNVSEFGISCEACHGPAEEHIAWHRDATRSGRDSDPIVNPENLGHQLSSQVCGQCHSITTHLTSDTLNNGDRFRPGDTLDVSRHLYRRNESSVAHLQQRGETDPHGFFDTMFWQDGSVRVTGREYNGLVESPCFQRGKMSCSSCHAMHQDTADQRPPKDWADDQLEVGMRDDKACIQCHNASDYGSKHTHHAEGSSGASCYNCHMPNTTYGLMKATRSHTITSPNLSVDLGAKRPNACNLCHLDQTQAWTSDWLSKWYNQPKPSLTKDQQTVAASVLWALTGDAGKRALAAWHFGWTAAREASGDQWSAPIMIHLLDDPYDAVRYIAEESLRSRENFKEIDFDFVGSQEKRTAQQAAIFKFWNAQKSKPSENLSRVLTNADGGLMIQEYSRLARQRDNRDVILNE